MIGVTSIVGNLITVIVILKFRIYKHSQYIYKFSIGVSDFLLGFVILYYLVQHTCFIFLRFHTDQLLTSNFVRTSYKDFFSENIDFSNSSILLKIILFPGYTCIHVSSLTLAFSAYDRYKSIADPFLYKKTNNVKRAVYSSFFVWFLEIITTVTWNFLQDKYGSDFIELIRLSFLLFYCFPFALMWIFTLLCIFSLIKSYKSSKKLNRSYFKRRNTELRLSVLFFAMVVAYTLSTSMYICIYIHSVILGYSYDTNLVYISFTLLTTNSTWNFILYNLMNKKFRTYVKLLFVEN